ncbi:hypothetical protein BRAO375_210009 [Bradyrhizobium sp. ORS 375]|nr:hypothetical protein BRAO375_210009 [Bradyrhizobium sp. ORS 375]
MVKAVFTNRLKRCCTTSRPRDWAGDGPRSIAGWFLFVSEMVSGGLAAAFDSGQGNRGSARPDALISGSG